jgi:predicted nucleotidyltransferase
MPTENRALSFGLKETTIEKIQGVLARYPEIEKAVLYGSRAKGNYRNGSDIDLTLMGDGLTHNQLLRIEMEIDDLLLPYKMDLSLYRQIENSDLLKHIDRVGITFYQGAKNH